MSYTIDLTDLEWHIDKDAALGGKLKANESQENDGGEEQHVFNVLASTEIFGNSILTARKFDSIGVGTYDHSTGDYAIETELAYTGKRTGGATIDVEFYVRYPDGGLQTDRIVNLSGQDDEFQETYRTTFDFYQRGEYHIGLIVTATATAAGGGSYVDYRANPLIGANRHINFGDEVTVYGV